MKSHLRIFIALVMIVGLVGGAIAYMMYNKSHVDVANAKPVYSVTAPELYQEFEDNDSLASLKYDSKVLALEGQITGISKVGDSVTVVMLSIGKDAFGSVKCMLDPEFSEAIEGYESPGSIRIKGIFSGVNKVDELGLLILDLELTRCVVINDNQE